MEVSGSNELQYHEEHALNTLLDAFGSVFSLKDIASAYCEANRNVDVAGEILFKMQENPTFVDASASNGKSKCGETLGSFHGNNPQNSFQAIGDLRTQKQKWRPVSGGTVSSMLGKGYMKPTPSVNSSNPRTKPLKVDSKEWPMSVLWGEECKSSSLKEDRLHKDMEDFLFKMLGLGFQLERNVISEVLANCGYDMQKSMEKLLDRSAAGLDERNKFLGESNKKTNDMHPRAEEVSREKNKVLNANGGARQPKDRNEIQKEVLTALFNNGPTRLDESPPRRMRPAKRSIAFGELVEGPLLDSVVKEKVDSVGSDKKDDEDEEEDSFLALRRAVEEHRGTMKEYYKAAIEAFAKGDQGLANRLLEKGQFYREKARQADEESNQKIFDTRSMTDTEDEDEISLDLHDHGAKEAIRLLKCHLSSLAGIPSFKYLKVIVDKNEDDLSKGSRRRLVMRLLEKESITCSEGETFGIIRIRLDNINPKNLSFTKKNPSL